MAGTVPPGALRENCLIIRDMLADPNKTVMHIVTTPEEMPVTEALELNELLRAKLGEPDSEQGSE